MNENEMDSAGFNRRDFLRGGSAATLMTMLGGVELFSQGGASAAEESTSNLPKVKVALIGAGQWGREIMSALAREPASKVGDVVALCDTYPAAMKRVAKDAPNAKQVADYKAILDDKDIKAVIVATPTHQHKQIVLDALKAGKHVYCEAPLANNIDDARAIALAAKDAKNLVFQAGLQLRADPQRHFLVPFIRSGAMGQFLMARGQWHKKTSWRSPGANSEREKSVNWRLDKDLSLGLIGEVGCHQVDQANWFFNLRPRSVTGFGSLLLYTDDGREVPDTVQAVFEYPGGITLNYNATLANFYGSFAAIMLRESKAWLFKEVDSPLLGWEVYARKENFYKETGIALVANASKSVQPTEAPADAQPVNTTLANALEIYLKNVREIDHATEDYIANFGGDDFNALKENIGKIQKRAAAGFLEGYQATVTSIKANEAVTTGKKVEIKKELYELS